MQRGDKVWILSPPSFYKVRPVESDVEKVGRQYFYVRPINDGTYKNGVRFSLKTFKDSEEFHSWTAYLTEESCMAEYMRCKPYTDARELFHSTINVRNLTDNDLVLCAKVVEIIRQHSVLKGDK